MASRSRALSGLQLPLIVLGSFLLVESLSPLAWPTMGFLEAGQPAVQHTSNTGFCVPLENRGSFSAVVLEVGQPQQRLSVVADTGSSAVIVASCECQHCTGLSNCYRKTKSSMFVAGPDVEVVMSFGSGDVKAKIVTDVVAVGASSVLMKDGVFEMIDMKMSFSMALEGILGLGPPPSIEGGYEGIQEKHFMTEAKINHFSFCLQSSGPGGGVLQFAGRQSIAKQLGNVGKVHWALGFNGISVGSVANSRMPFCSPFNMEQDQTTPCGAIPDSGTTMISAPKSHLAELMTGLCDGWPRCATAAGQRHLIKSKEAIFLDLLRRCNEWVHDGQGLDELPTLHFHVTGSDGVEEPIALSPWSYVIEMPLELYQSHIRKLPGFLALQPHPPPLDAEVCAPAFGATKMITEQNGPVWILGTSFFYEYNVHYNMKPQTVSFERGACGTCDGAGVQGDHFIEGGLNVTGGGQGDHFIEAGGNGTGARRWVRRLSTPPRLPEKYHNLHGIL